jgi:tetratricopeptide (TPR) repeat protein
MVRGHVRQSAPLWQQLAVLLDAEPSGDPDPLARVWMRAAGWTNQGEFTKAVELLDEVLPGGRGLDWPPRIALLLMARGVALVDFAHERARADFAEALSVAQAAADQLALGYVRAHYGALLCLDGDLDRARALHEETLSIARSIGDENLRGEAHHALAMDVITAGDSGSAASHLTAAVRHYQNLDHFEGLARCVGALSALVLERGDPHLSARLIGTAAAVRDRFGLKPWPWVTQAEGRTIERVATLLPSREYAAQLVAGRSQTIDEAFAAARPILDDRQPEGAR